MGEEARQHIVALVLAGCTNSVIEQKHEKWNSGTGWVDAVQLSEVEQRVANCQQEMANEFDRFTQRLSDFINQEIHQFG